MRRILYLFLGAILIGGGLSACDSTGDDDTSGIVTLTGRVLNADTNNPVPNAFITILPFNLQPIETDEDGGYEFDIEIDSTMNLQIRANKDGFTTDQTTVLALAGRTIEVPTLRLRETVEQAPVSGMASNILLLEQSSQSIGVRESGSEEVAQITFQVQDSIGRPVTIANAENIRFSFGTHPGGGEFLEPTEARTDNNGQVTVNLSSGTRAGVVQILAETEVEGNMVRSMPVSVSIHGGLPDQRHFTLGPDRFNFPGLLRFGITNQISVIVGDKYSNPVKPGTSVYFETSHAVIEGSALTNATGGGTVQLISANPLPPLGIAVVRATTADENQQIVSSQIPVLLTGVPEIQVTPGEAILGQTYRLRVWDWPNRNPLVEGTSITVRAEGTKVKAVGSTAVSLGDAAFVDQNGDGDVLDYEDILRGEGITEFRFRAVEDLTLDEAGEPTLEAITITISGENGRLELVLLPAGTDVVFSASKKGVVHSQEGEWTVVRLQEEL